MDGLSVSGVSYTIARTGHAHPSTRLRHDHEARKLRHRTRSPGNGFYSPIKKILSVYLSLKPASGLSLKPAPCPPKASKLRVIDLSHGLSNSASPAALLYRTIQSPEEARMPSRDVSDTAPETGADSCGASDVGAKQNEERSGH